jgi:lipopolysaccharide biosynthesis protein
VDSWYSLASEFTENNTREIVLYVVYLRGQKVLSAEQQRMLRAFQSKNLTIVLIVNTDNLQQSLSLHSWLRPRFPQVTILYRKNRGFDFAAWAHALWQWPELWGMRRLWFFNDSVWGPYNDHAWNHWFYSVENSKADVLGLTENFNPCWHIQSYGFVLQKKSLCAQSLRRFWANIRCCLSKEMVIQAYELGLSHTIKQARLNVHIVYRLPQSFFKIDPTFVAWQDLLKIGYPFIKASALIHWYKQYSMQYNRVQLQQSLQHYTCDLYVLERYLKMK